MKFVFLVFFVLLMGFAMFPFSANASDVVCSTTTYVNSNCTDTIISSGLACSTSSACAPSGCSNGTYRGVTDCGTGSCSTASGVPTCVAPTTCTPSWSCSDWSPTSGACGTTYTQTRTCTDSNSCGTNDGKPSESQTATGYYCATGTCNSGTCTTPTPTPAPDTSSPTSITFTQSPSGNQINDTSVTYTATANHPLTNGDTYGIYIYEAGTSIASCTSGTSCSTSGIAGSGQTITFTAKLVDLAEGFTVKSLSITTTWGTTVAPSSITISANPSGNQSSGTNVTYTVTTNTDVGGVYAIDIYDQTNAIQIGSACGTGTSCSATTNGTNQTKTIVGQVKDTSGNVILTSSSISTTWAAPTDTTPPAVSVSGASASWQSSDATATIGCSDASGCETNTNWQYSTPSSNPGTCSAATGGYTSYNGTGITISDHRWVCASAKDTKGNTGYSTPIEFQVDKTPPVPAINSPVASSWQKAGSFSVSVTNSDSGGSGLLSCNYAVYDKSDNFTHATTHGTFTPCSGNTANSTFSIGAGSGLDCSTQGVDSCYAYILTTDTAGNTEVTGRYFSIDYTLPEVHEISPPTATVGEAVKLSATVSDATSGIDISSCNLFVESKDKGTMTVSVLGGITTASKLYTFPVALKYNDVYALCKDNAGNQQKGISVSVTAVVPALSYPSNAWERFWYKTSGASPTFSDIDFLREGPGSPDKDGISPNIASADGLFVTDWASNPVYIHTDGTVYAENVGFKSSRTINFPTTKTYRFTIGSDDGARLYIDRYNNAGVEINPTPAIDLWTDGNYTDILLDRPKFKDIAITAGDHKIELDFYEHTGNAKVSFAYALAPCQKTATPITESPLTLSNGCSVTITHLGLDYTDKSAVSYESYIPAGALANTTYIKMSDDPPSSCADNLNFQNTWAKDKVTGYNLSTTTQFSNYSATHDLGYGYQVSSNNCVIKSQTGDCSGGVGALGCPVPTASTDTSTTIYGKKQATGSTIDPFSWNYSFVECTKDSQCTTTGKTFCNDGTTHNTGNFPLNTCIDSVAPISTITSESDAANFTSPLGSPNKRLLDNTYWLKGTTYTIKITDSDGTGSGIDNAQCTYTIDDLGRTGEPGETAKTRTCNGSVPVSVGPSGDCQTQGEKKCELVVKSKDKANNQNNIALPISFRDLNIDYTPPTAQ